MKYKLPTGGEKRRICRLLFARLVELSRQATNARERGTFWEPKPWNVAYNPYSGRFRVVPPTCKKRKNEIWITREFPTYDIVCDLRDGYNPAEVGYNGRIENDLSCDFLAALRAENIRGSRWPVSWLAAERLLEIANERRTDYDD